MFGKPIAATIPTIKGYELIDTTLRSQPLTDDDQDGNNLIPLITML
jgi:hypothetical protein